MALSAKVKMNLLLTGPSKPLGFPLGTTLLPAVVLTVMVSGYGGRREGTSSEGWQAGARELEKLIVPV
jgi:hypothetical protein